MFLISGKTRILRRLRISSESSSEVIQQEQVYNEEIKKLKLTNPFLNQSIGVSLKQTGYINLENVMVASKKIDFSVKVPLMIFLHVPLLDALRYLYANHIVHRDIKPTNILIANGSFKPVLSNFSFAVKEEPNMKDVPNTNVAFQSPQMIEKKRYGCVTDIYSWTISLLSCFYGGEQQVKYLKNPKINRYVWFIKKIKANMRLILMNTYGSQVLEDILYIMHVLQEKEEDRPTASELLKTRKIRRIWREWKSLNVSRNYQNLRLLMNATNIKVSESEWENLSASSLSLPKHKEIVWNQIGSSGIQEATL